MTSAGVTASTLTLSVSGPWSGPYGALLDRWYDGGFLTWLSDVNARGGVHGRKIAVKKVDNKGTADGDIAACKQEQSNGTFASFIFTGDDIEVDCLDGVGMPAFISYASSVSKPWRLGRAMQATPTAGTSLASFAASTLGGRGKKIGEISVALPVYQAARSAFLAKANALGLNVALTQTVAQNQATFVAEVTRMRDAGVGLIVLDVATEVLGILRDARAIGYRPAFTGAGWTFDEISAAARGLMDGIKALRLSTTTDAPAFKGYQAVAAKYGKSARTTTDAASYGFGQILEKALIAAGRDLTRQGFAEAFDRVRYDNGLNPPMAWRAGDTLGSRAWFPALCCNPDNTWKGLGPARVDF